MNQLSDLITNHFISLIRSIDDYESQKDFLENKVIKSFLNSSSSNAQCCPNIQTHKPLNSPDSDTSSSSPLDGQCVKILGGAKAKDNIKCTTKATYKNKDGELVCTKHKGKEGFTKIPSDIVKKKAATRESSSTSYSGTTQYSSNQRREADVNRLIDSLTQSEFGDDATTSTEEVVTGDPPEQAETTESVKISTEDEDVTPSS